MGKKKNKTRKIGKINPVLYHVAHAAVWLMYRKYHITMDKEAVKGLKGPAIVVATHTCDEDHLLSGMTLYPVRPTYIVSEHFMRNKSTAPLMKLMHVITKKMFTPDISTIMNVMRAKKENAVIVIFPEGRLSCYGHSLPVTEGTAELVKKLGVPLYAWKAEGAYLTFPKWREKGDSRPGKINTSLRLLLSADEVATTDVCEIKRITEDAIRHDDELAMAGVEYRSDAIAKGVDRILYKCPVCLREGGISAEGDRIRCECGMEATLDNTYRLHGVRFERVNEWFEWQQAEINPEKEHLESKVKLGCPGEDGYMDENAGEGYAYIDAHEFRLKGQLYGEPVEFSVRSDRIGAFPITPGRHFDIYHEGRLIYVYPQPDERMTVKWVSYLDRLSELRRALPAEKGE